MRELAIEGGNCELCNKSCLDLTLRDWNLKGLHEDEYLKESAQIVLETGLAKNNFNEKRLILLFDPQELGIKWLKQVLQVYKYTNTDMQKE